MTQYTQIEKDVLARTLWGEARGEGEKGMRAVACVILNRVSIAKEKGRYWWGNNVIQVCQKPYQFSCWNKSDPNYEKITAGKIDDKAFQVAQEIAKCALESCLADITHGATHYYAKSIPAPEWAKGLEPCAVIGNHKFYRIVDA